MRHKAVYTTGQAAEVCRLSQQTIIRCFDSGQLDGFRVPGSKFRRIPRKNLIEFMKVHSFPLAGLEETNTRVLIVDDDPIVTEVISRMLKAEGGFKVEVAQSGFRAGVLAKGFKPDVLVLDIMLGDINGKEVCKIIREDPSLKSMKILAISGKFESREAAMEFMDGMFDDYIGKPFEAPVLMKHIKKLTD